MIVPVASELLPAYLDVPEWQKHHATLIALAQIAKVCSNCDDKKFGANGDNGFEYIPKSPSSCAMGSY
ncbi:unnamed protein product, partial [Vitis vinifera]|uniref:Uncharacterized protein n=1 Tax=Vitis vinifera TaxID=29760 RepID=D7UAJ9_VITVI